MSLQAKIIILKSQARPKDYNKLLRHIGFYKSVELWSNGSKEFFESNPEFEQYEEEYYWKISLRDIDSHDALHIGIIIHPETNQFVAYHNLGCEIGCCGMNTGVYRFSLANVKALVKGLSIWVLEDKYKSWPRGEDYNKRLKRHLAEFVGL